jgi:AcrR family transcriptional regulator
MQQANTIVQAARRLIESKGASFTTQELVKEAGVALQTFYRYFEGKDQLLLAVMENMMVESCAEYERSARRLPNPVARLHFYVTTVVSVGSDEDGGRAASRFITTEHWRLHQLYPEELAQAISPYTHHLLTEIRAATEAGTLTPRHPEYDAWLVTQLAVAVFHHYAFAATRMPLEEIRENLWAFCFSALGGTVETGGERRRSSPRRARSR